MMMICVIICDIKSLVNISWPGLIAAVSYIYHRIIQMKFRKRGGGGSVISYLSKWINNAAC